MVTNASTDSCPMLGIAIRCKAAPTSSKPAEHAQRTPAQTPARGHWRRGARRGRSGRGRRHHRQGCRPGHTPTDSVLLSRRRQARPLTTTMATAPPWGAGEWRRWRSWRATGGERRKRRRRRQQPRRPPIPFCKQELVLLLLRAAWGERGPRRIRRRPGICKAGAVPFLTASNPTSSSTGCSSVW